MGHGEDLIGMMYEKGDIVFRQGESGETMYIIQSGAVEVSINQGEDRKILAILEKGGTFGEMALLQEAIRTATVKTLSRTRLLPITKTSLVNRLKQDPGTSLNLLNIFIQRLQQTDQTIQHHIKEPDTPQTDDIPADDSDLAKDSFEPCNTGPDHQLSDVSAKEIAELWNVAIEPKSFVPEQVIFQTGDTDDSMYIITKGSVEVSHTVDNQKRIIATLYAGDFFGEMALLNGAPRYASVTALTPTETIPITRETFLQEIPKNPELAIHLLQSVIARLNRQNTVLSEPEKRDEIVRPLSWRPIIKKDQLIRIAIISLSTCAGCSAVLLDAKLLAKLFEKAEIIYCPMLMDQDEIPECDVALIDGVVRLKEEVERLEEARRQSRFVVAWGTCATYGGIPAMANRYDLEELIEETYGLASDTFDHYLPGNGGNDYETTSQFDNTWMLRRAGNLDEHCRVDYCIPGCPPEPNLLYQLLLELSGDKFQKAKPVVCSECRHKPVKQQVDTIESFPSNGENGNGCLASQGITCAGFLTRGGCRANCLKAGLPCWGCRGASNQVAKKMNNGETFEDIAIASLMRRCKLDEDVVKPIIKILKIKDYGLCNFEHALIRNISRIR